jgi:hypothetical protein
MAHEVEQRLDQAIELLRADGWTQRNFYNRDGQRCMAGAIANHRLVRHTELDRMGVIVCDDNDAVRWAQRTLTEVLIEVYGTPDIVEANDHIMTRADEAIGALEKARARASELGI